MLIGKLKRLFGQRELPREARDLINNSEDIGDLLEGLDQLITRNEIEVNKVTEQMSHLELLEGTEADRIRSGELPERSKNNSLRRIQRLRKQMDNLEERQRIYNRNINLQIDLVGRVQALEAMEMRGVDEDRIDDILSDYEDELGRYQSLIDADLLTPMTIEASIDDSAELAALEAQVVGGRAAAPEPAPSAPEPAAKPAAKEAAPRRQPSRPAAETTPASTELDPEPERKSLGIEAPADDEALSEPVGSGVSKEALSGEELL